MPKEMSSENTKRAGSGFSIINIILSATMLGLGISAQRRCNAEPMIPVYLIGMRNGLTLKTRHLEPLCFVGYGATNLSLFMFAVLVGILSFCVPATDCFKKLVLFVANILSFIIGLGHFVWLIFGTVYVFGVNSVSFQDPSLPDYCQKSAYIYAYFITVVGESL